MGNILKGEHWTYFDQFVYIMTNINPVDVLKYWKIFNVYGCLWEWA